MEYEHNFTCHMWTKDNRIRIQQQFIGRINWDTERSTIQTPRIIRIIKNPCTCLSSKIVRNDVGFTWSVFSNSIRSNAAPASMEGVDKHYEITSPEATTEVKVM